MAANTSPIFTLTPEFQSGGTLTTGALLDYTGQHIMNTVLFNADDTNGSFVQKIRCKALGTNTASNLRIFINNGKTRFAPAITAVAGTPTGTPSATGGTLRAGAYFAKVVAIDQYGALTAASTETASVAVTGTTGSIVWNWTAVTGAEKYRIYIGYATGAQGTYFEVTTNTFTQTEAVGTRDSLNGSLLNNFFFGELALPATTVIATTSTIDIEYPLNIALPPAYRILVGLSTTVAAGWHVTAVGGSY
jgi:hypothetical protein